MNQFVTNSFLFFVNYSRCIPTSHSSFLLFQLTPWNVDTISKPGFTKTVVNTNLPRKNEELTEEEKEERMKEFINQNEKLVKQFGMLRKYDDSKRFLQQHPQLVCEETANYLVIWCINLEMEEVCIVKIRI